MSEFDLAVRPNPKILCEIVYQDSDLLVVYKPAGMVTQPGKGHVADSMLNGLFALHGKALQNLGVKRDFGLLHRLDRPTSGLLLVALRPKAYDLLREDFEARRVDKDYLALVLGHPEPAQGVVQARLKEVVLDIKRVIISRQGQEAISSYQTLSRGPKASLVQVGIKTGRLHQIRAHMLFLGNPVIGDDLYGVDLLTKANLTRPPRLCLHAAHLGFKHPIQGQWMHFWKPWPADLTPVAGRLGVAIPPVGQAVNPG